MILAWMLACAPHPPLSDPARGGPPLHPGQAPLPPFSGVSRATATYVGADVCGACHAAAAAAWSQSGHALALATLEAALHSHDPECLACHITGLGHPGGGVPGDAHLANVQCEACHGPGSDHAAAPARGYGTLPGKAAACVGCHTHDQSPDFAFAPYWGRVAHGKD